MAKSKYTKKIVAVIIDAIREFGSDQVAYRMAGIGHSAFYDWKNKYPEFEEAIAQAKEDFRVANTDTELGKAALVAAKNILRDGKTITRTIKRGKRTTYRKDPKTGKMEEAEFVLEEPTTEVVHYPPTEALIKLHTPLDLGAAQALLEKHGYLVIDPTVAAQEEETGGITDDTYHEITGKILGVETRELDADSSPTGENSQTDNQVQGKA